MITKGHVVKECEKGFYVFVPCINHKNEIRAAKELLIEIPDPRRISIKQRKKIYVLLSFIAAWWSYTPLETIKEIMKLMFRGQAGYEIFDKDFSLSNCDMTTARLFITYLIDFCLLHDVELGEPAYKLCEDIPRYVWACLMNKKCAVCGRKHVDIHHVDAIGMGRNRNKVFQIGMPVLSLCREHHRESHNIGQDSFLKKYFLQPIPLTEEIGRLYPLTNTNLGV